MKSIKARIAYLPFPSISLTRFAVSVSTLRGFLKRYVISTRLRERNAEELMTMIQARPRLEERHRGVCVNGWTDKVCRYHFYPKPDSFDTPTSAVYQVSTSGT